MSEEIGKRMGDYQILSELGSGGMGRVYKVKNVLSDRVEAMKVLLPDVATRQELAARFQREIKLLASLNHPNIAALRTALTIDNQLVMIMEYVEGTTLADRLSQGTIPVADTLSYMDQVLNALSYAHQQHVIHRDIKPANIILTPQGVIKVMDFGIARSGDDRSLTMTGTTLGSLSYMSPEQVKGEPTDARSDLYSVGITLYELATGQRPFQAHSDYSIMAAHVKETPRPPIELEHGLPPMLNDIILMAISKDPAQRFQTADAFRNALRSVEVPVAASQPVVGTIVSSPDAATATFSVASAPAATQATIQTPTPVQAPAVTPAAARPVTPVQPMPPMPMPPPAPSTHRGLYMTLGALIVLAGLVVAGIYVPRMSKTQATSSPVESQPAAAPASTSTAPDAAQTPPIAPTAPDAASTTPTSQPMTQPAAAAEAAPKVETSTATSATPPSQPAPQPHKSASKTSGGMVNAALQESVAATKSNMAAQSTNAMTSAASTNPGSTANFDELEDQVEQLSNRASAVDSSLDQLQQQQNAAGYGLRGDIVARHASMTSNMAKAHQAVQQKDAVKAQKYLGLAQGDVEALEHFLGR